MKKKILQILRERGGFVSGQELCETLQVSRTAVWKQIRQLEKDGYRIEAVTGKGYRMTGVPDSIRAAEVESRLHTEWAGRPVYYFDEITSTNLYAKQLAEEGAPEGLLVVADAQTKGRGRSGRSWSNPPGTNIAMTLMLRPSLPPEKISMVTLVAGMAVCSVCRKLYDVPAQIKWPNDVVLDGKKICGILTEMSTEISKVSYIVIGIGINVNLTVFPEELQEKATSLCLYTGQEENRAGLIAECMQCFEKYYAEFAEAESLAPFADMYNEMLVSRDRTVRVLEPGNEFTGTALGIDEQGQLLVRKDSGEICRVYSGEVSVRGIYGYNI